MILTQLSDGKIGIYYINLHTFLDTVYSVYFTFFYTFFFCKGRRLADERTKGE